MYLVFSFLSFFFFLSLSLCLFIYRSTNQPTNQPASRPIHPSSNQPVDQSISQSNQIISICLSIRPTIYLGRCNISYDLASLFCGRRSNLDKWRGEIANVLARGRQLCTQLSIFEGLSRRIGLLFTLPPSNFGGSLAEYHHFGAQNFYFLRVACRIAWFWTRQLPLLKEVSHNCYLSDGKTN